MNASVRQVIDGLIKGKGLPDLGALGAIMGELDALGAPAEEAFLAIGSVLGEASNLLGGIQAGFADLMEHLEGTESSATATRLVTANERIASLTGGSHGSTEVLAQLGLVIKQIEARLLALSKVVGEVGALALNAKVQASLIESGGADFTVFTTEIQRLGALAGQTIDQTRFRLRELDVAIADAVAGEKSFEREASRELVNVQGRLAEGLEILVTQRRVAANAAERIGRHSQDTSQRVVACLLEGGVSAEGGDHHDDARRRRRGAFHRL